MVPKIAIIDPNTLASIGLKSILQTIMPNIHIDTFNSFRELEINKPEDYYHYFAAISIVLSNYQFFVNNIRKTIVMTMSSDPNSNLDRFHCLCINVPENHLIKSLLYLEQSAHKNGKRLPPEAMNSVRKNLSDREIEVLTLIVKGFINKEIAEKLNIGLSTVITHRHNITEKLHRKSVGALTIYAVMHRYVNICDI